MCACEGGVSAECAVVIYVQRQQYALRWTSAGVLITTRTHSTIAQRCTENFRACQSPTFIKDWYNCMHLLARQRKFEGVCVVHGVDLCRR